MNKSESIKEIATALCKAQAEMSGAVKDANNPFFKSKYADLGSVVKAVKEPFANNGLSYCQFPLMLDGKVGVETILMHESGEWISGELVLPVTKQDPQAAGSAITYARRYGLQSVAGIPAEDDDGNNASKPARAGAAVPYNPKQGVPTQQDAQWIDAIQSGKSKLEDINDPQYRAIIKGFLI